MSNYKKKGRRTGPDGRSMGIEPYTNFQRHVINSDAFRSLSPLARAMYMELKFLYNGKNNGEIFMSVRFAAERLNVWGNTATKALKELQEKGFIIPNVKGSFNQKVRHATTWILTELSYKDGLPTKDYMRFRPASKI